MTTLMGFQDSRDGYGYATTEIGEAWQELDPSLKVIDMAANGGDGWDGDDIRWRVPGTAVVACTPDWLPHIRADRLILLTMFEATKLPDGWVEQINKQCNSLIVPCSWCKEIFRDNGVAIPISVVRWGINDRDYYPLERNRKPGAPYTFLWSGTSDWRKGWNVAYEAFIKAFGHREDVRLILHFRRPLRFGQREAKFADPNVIYTVGRVDRFLLRLMLREADCFVFPSRGEGWGLPPREAAATGLPVIATNYGGLAEEIIDWAIPLGVKGMTPAWFGQYQKGSVGEWPEPDVDELAARMAQCVEYPQAAKDLGASAAQWLAANTPWARTAQGLIDVVGMADLVSDIRGVYQRNAAQGVAIQAE